MGRLDARRFHFLGYDTSHWRSKGLGTVSGRSATRVAPFVHISYLEYHRLVLFSPSLSRSETVGFVAPSRSARHVSEGSSRAYKRAFSRLTDYISPPHLTDTLSLHHVTTSAQSLVEVASTRFDTMKFTTFFAFLFGVFAGFCAALPPADGTFKCGPKYRTYGDTGNITARDRPVDARPKEDIPPRWGLMTQKICDARQAKCMEVS